MKEIVCKLNPEDTFSIVSSHKEVNLWRKDAYHYNFWDKNKRKLYQISKCFSSSAIDLLNISLMVYYADRAVLRDKEIDRWTRSIKVGSKF